MTKRKVQVSEQDQLRELLTEMHGAIKDGTALLRKMQETMSTLEIVAGEVFDEKMEAVVEQKLEEYRDSMRKHTDEAHDAVVARFDRLYDILVGNTEQDRDIPSVAELVDLYRAHQTWQLGDKVLQAASREGLTIDDLLTSNSEVVRGKVKR